MDLRLTALLAALALTSLALWPAQAAATHVTCGDTITQDTKLDSDLVNCPGDGIVIGADKITLDLNGRTIAGTPCRGDDCVPQDGIDNSSGHDRVVIKNGTITAFENGVVLQQAERNELTGLTICHCDRGYAAPGTALSLTGSDENRVLNTEALAGDPAIQLSDSDRNSIEQSHVGGGIAIHAGDGIRLGDSSDSNRLIRNAVGAEGRGIAVWGARHNVLKANVAGGHAGNELSGAERTVIVGNTFYGGPSAGLALYESDEDVIRNNAVTGLVGISVFRSARNVIEANSVKVAEDGIDLYESNDNTVRGNDVTGEWRGISISGAGNIIRSNSVDSAYDGIAVLASSTATVLDHNVATHAPDDGIDVDAPLTLIRGNVANDNGDLGIEAVEGVIDGGGNRASGNGNPLQCLNVLCK